jgi:hypothetical protein
MKMLLKILLISAIAIQANAQRNVKVKNIRKTLDQIAQDYSPTAHTVFTHVPKMRYQKYINHKTMGYILDYYIVPVHEATHYYNNLVRKRCAPQKFIEANTGAGYFIYPNIEIGMADFPVYHSSDLNDIIPDSIQHKMDNYDTYIRGEDIENSSSDVNGIFGLMDEFTAYSTGAKSQLELYNYFLANTEDGFENIEVWDWYINRCAAGIYDFYEFKIFIHWYLENSKKSHSEEYAKIMANKNLRLAFTLVEQNYLEAIKSYYQRLDFICEQSQEYDVSLSFDYYENRSYKSLLTSKKHTSPSSVLELYEEEMNFCKALYASMDPSILNDFRVEGATKQNYKEFLE